MRADIEDVRISFKKKIIDIYVSGRVSKTNRECVVEMMKKKK